MSGGRRRGLWVVVVAVGCLAIAAGAAVDETDGTFVDSASPDANAFSTAASFGGGSCPSTAPTGVELLTGFESGRLLSSMGSFSSFFFQATGAISLDTTIARNSSYSLKVAPAGSTANVYAVGSGSYRKTAHFAVRLQALPTADVRELFSVGNGQTNSFMGMVGYRYNGGNPTFAVQMRNSSGVLTPAIASTVTVSAGEWYVIDLAYDSSGTTHTMAWRVNGVDQTTASQAGTANTAAYYAWVGTTVAATYTANFDDVVVGYDLSAYPFSDGSVKRLVPDGQGTNNLLGVLTNEVGGTADAGTWWQRLDETPPASNDYIVQTTVNTSAYAEVTFEDTTASCVVAVTANLYSTAENANKHATSQFRVIDGATTRIVWNYNMDTGAAGTVTGMGAIIPPTGAAWTPAELNGLLGRVGFASSIPNGAAKPRWDALELQYLAL